MANESSEVNQAREQVTATPGTAATAASGAESYTAQLAAAESNIGNARTKLRDDIRFRTAFLAISGGFFALLAVYYLKVLPLASWLVIAAWFIAVFFLLVGFGATITVAELREQIQKSEASKRVYAALLNLPETSGTQGYFDRLVTINVENLAAYYALVQSHTAKSFAAATISGICGFALVLVGLSVGFADPKFANIGYVGAAAGTIINMLSGIFFYLYNRTVIQLKGYHDSLLHVQNILLSFKLIESIKDENHKNILMQKMIEYLVGTGKVPTNLVTPAAPA